MKKNLKLISAAIMASCALMLAGCSGSGSEETTATQAEASGENTEASAEGSEASKDEASAEAEGDETQAVDTPNIDAIKEKGKLVLGTSADYPPYEFHTQIDGVDTIVGFDISIAQYFADGLGVELEIVDMPFDSLLIDLSQGGKLDIVMAGLTPDEERKKAADFTDILFENFQIVMIRKEDADKLTSVESLQGHKVGAQTGSMPYDLAVESVGAENVVGLGKSQDLVMELKNGNIDAIFTNTMSAEPFVKANDDLMIQDIGLPASDGGNAAAVGKGKTDLVDYCNEKIAELKESGMLDEFIVEAQELANQE